MRKVIVNSTPLIILSSINALDILKQLYGKIYIPYAVFKEVTVKQDSAANQIKKHIDTWIHIEKISSNADKKIYKSRLHDGEVEVMILAQEKNADLVIIDDNAAKKTAKYLGLPVTGTLGVLLKAKQKGIIDNLAIYIKNMKYHNFYISKELEDFILSTAKE